MLGYFTLFLLIVSISVAPGPVLQQQSEDVDLETLAEKACHIFRVDCCIDKLRGNEPMECEKSLEENIRIVMNIEKEMSRNNTFGAKAFPCCEVFNHDEKFGRKCRNVCQNSFMTPLLTDEQKLVMISTCRRENKYLQCFLDCINHDFNEDPNPPKSCDV